MSRVDTKPLYLCIRKQQERTNKRLNTMETMIELSLMNEVVRNEMMALIDDLGLELTGLSVSE